MGNGRIERIESIIQQRKPLSERVSKTNGLLSGVLEQMELFKSRCDEILQGEFAAQVPEIRPIHEQIMSLKEDARSLKTDLDRLQNRFSRDTLNIAVIGRARQGKSRLLQTITGLSTEEIPDGNLQFCTGVRSDIINEPLAEAPYVRVHFLSERRFLQDNVWSYFDALREYLPAEISRPSAVLQKLRGRRAPRNERAHVGTARGVRARHNVPRQARLIILYV